MANNTTDIHIGDEMVRVPSWATEETQQEFIKLAKETKGISEKGLKSLIDICDSAKATTGGVFSSGRKLDKILSSIGTSTKSSNEQNDALIRSVKALEGGIAKQNQSTDTVTSPKNNKNNKEKDNESITSIISNKLRSVANMLSPKGTFGASISDASKNIGDSFGDKGTIAKGTKSLRKSLDGVAEGSGGMARAATVAQTGLKAVGAFAKTLGPIGAIFSALGSVVGATVSVAQEFSKSMADTMDTGLGVATNFVSLNMSAANLGLNLDQFGDLVSRNHKVMRLFGDNTARGAENYAMYAQSQMDSASQFGYFGNSAKEYGELLADEMEMARLRGATESTQLKKAASGFNDVYKSQLALADLNGQDVKDRMAARQAQSVNYNALDVAAQYGQEQAQLVAKNLQFVASELGTEQWGELGPMLMNAINQSLATNVDMGVVNSALAQSVPEAQEFLDMIKAGMLTEDKEAFKSMVLQKVGSMMGNLTFGQGETASLMRNNMIEGFSEVQNAISSMRIARLGLKNVTDAMAKDQENIIDLAAKSGRLQAAGLDVSIETVKLVAKAGLTMKALDTLGIDIENVGKSMVRSLEWLTEKINEAVGNDMEKIAKNNQDRRNKDAVGAAQVDAGLDIGFFKTSVDENNELFKKFVSTFNVGDYDNLGKANKNMLVQLYRKKVEEDAIREAGGTPELKPVNPIAFSYGGGYNNTTSREYSRDDIGRADYYEDMIATASQQEAITGQLAMYQYNLAKLIESNPNIASTVANGIERMSYEDIVKMQQQVTGIDMQADGSNVRANMELAAQISKESSKEIISAIDRLIALMVDN